MTLAEFQLGVEKLKNKNPGHDILIILEERGFDLLTVEYLRLALAEPDEEPEISFARLQKQKASLYSKRAVKSNKFHECTTDEERKEVSILISSIQTEIVSVKRAISAYEETGVLPKKKARTLPLDGRAQQKKIHSLQSSQSRFANKLRAEKDPDKIKYYEGHLTRIAETLRELSA
jgi:hypothetical protein